MQNLDYELNTTAKYLENYFKSAFLEEYSCQWLYLDDLTGYCYNVLIFNHIQETFSGDFFLKVIEPI